MARVNVYLPDDLATQVKDAELNVSGIAQDALRAALDDHATDAWLDDLADLGPLDVSHDDVIDALDAAADEFGSRAGT